MSVGVKILSNFLCIAHSYHLISCFSRFKGNVYCLDITLTSYFLHTHTHTRRRRRRRRRRILLKIICSFEEYISLQIIAWILLLFEIPIVQSQNQSSSWANSSVSCANWSYVINWGLSKKEKEKKGVTLTERGSNIFIEWMFQNQMNCVRALAVGLRINTGCSMQHSMVSPMWKLCINVCELIS